VSDPEVADELFQRSEERLIGEGLASGCFSDPEVDNFRDRRSLVVGHQDVGGLNIAVDDALLVRMLDGLANQDKKLKPLGGVEPSLITVAGDGNPLD
jgi:hypothetical protein